MPFKLQDLESSSDENPDDRQTWNFCELHCDCQGLQPFQNSDFLED